MPRILSRFMSPIGRDPFGHGQTGAEIGALAGRPAKLVAELRRGLTEAYDRARFSARKKAELIAHLGDAAKGLLVAPIPSREKVRDDVDATFRRDPRALSTDELKKISLDASHEVAALGDAIAYQVVAAMTEMRREIFIDTAGTVVSQAYAFSQGDCYVVAQIGDGHQESYDSIGQQRGLECLSDGWRGELMPNPSPREILRRPCDRGARACRGASPQAARRRSRRRYRPAFQRARLARGDRPSVRSRPRAQDGSRVRRAQLVPALARRQPVGQIRSRRRCSPRAPIRVSTATAIIATTTKARAGAA